MKLADRDIGRSGMHDWDKSCEEFGPLVWAAVYRVLNDYAHSLDCYQDVMLEAFFKKTRNRDVADWPSLLRWLAVRRAIDRLRQRERTEAFAIVSSAAVENVATEDGPIEAARLKELNSSTIILCDSVTAPSDITRSTRYYSCLAYPSSTFTAHRSLKVSWSDLVKWRQT